MRQSLAPAFKDTLTKHFRSRMSGPLFKSFIEVVCALVSSATATRGWYGRLTLWDIARSMTTKGTAKTRYKRVRRFLCNPRLVGAAMMGGLFGFSGAEFFGSIVPVLIDQTSLCADAVQAIVASFPFGGRAIPLMCETMDSGMASGSQNIREWSLLQRMIMAVRRAAVQAVYIMDRGYAKLILIARLLEENVLFVIRGCRNVVIEYHEEGAGPRRVALGRLRHRQGVPTRYRNVKYLDGGRARVDIIVYRERGFAEPWFLIVPPNSEDSMPTDRVVQWYRWRMRIEISFRDFKSCMGVRKGLRFEVNAAAKMARIFTCLAVAYIILLGLGQTAQARRIRKDMEVRRRRARHGTRRTLSVLTVAVLTVIDCLHDVGYNPCRLFTNLMECWTCGVFSPGFDGVSLV
jgi:hypothetical protein